tara:strand:- start:652 stop:993 length:342 start_codon:yes stop_codon:yes gene_type:complete
MAIIPATKNFDVVKKADFPLRLTFKDSTGSAISLNGYTVSAQVWDVNRKVKFADWGVTYTNRGSGIVDIKLTDIQTDNFIVGTLKYDVKLTEPSGDEYYYIKGNLNVSQGYTE